MTEISCENCKAACCKGSPLLVMQLTAEEVEFMRAGGNVFQPVAEPVDYDREAVIYPVGMQVDAEKGTFHWLAERGREYEPLPAGYGRYAMAGVCKYLGTNEEGWEYCTVYERRPGVCQDFEVASKKCVDLRAIQGVPLPDPKR